MGKKGNVFIYSTFFITCILVIFLVTIFIFISEVNSLLYNIKLDMYAINKSAIISVNKGITSREYFSYDDETYKECFIKMLKANYKLNDNLENENGIVQRVKILKYNIYSSNTGTTIQSTIEVKVRPIVFHKILENVFVFEIHESTALNMLEV